MSPARWAASTFCLTPPIGSTRPCSVTSPVMPTSCRTGRPVSSDTSAVGHRDAGRRAVLRDGAGGHVHVELAVGERVGVDAELVRRCERT